MLTVLLVLALAACEADAPLPPMPRTNTVVLESDGQVKRITTNATTVQELLAEAGIRLSDLDRVSPPEVSALVDGMTISVTRVVEDTQIITATVPFGRQVVRDADVPEGNTRLLQSGQSGVLARHYRVTYENGVEIARVLVREETISEPQDEIRLIGTRVQLQNIPISGTLTYLSGQDAWMIRDSAFQVRRLTTVGDLDGRVFSLSADGSRLLFTRARAGPVGATGTEQSPVPSAEGDTEVESVSEVVNELWLVRTTEASPNPVPLGLRDVLWAAWSPADNPATGTGAIAWSSMEAMEPAPGWRGNNDLWRGTVTTRNTLIGRREVREAEAGGGYGWWGTRYAWSPDGEWLAYSRPESVGVVDLNGSIAPLVTFPGFRTFSSWSWHPDPAWSPDGDLLSAVVHDGDGVDEPEESPVFNLLLTDPTGAYSATLAMEVGMWSTPSFSPDGERILFARALVPYQSATSAYALYLADRDGSGQRQIYGGEAGGGLTLPVWRWQPDGDAVVFVELGDIRLLTLAGEGGQNALETLTDDGGITRFEWR